MKPSANLRVLNGIRKIITATGRYVSQRLGAGELAGLPHDRALQKDIRREAYALTKDSATLVEQEKIDPIRVAHQAHIELTETEGIANLAMEMGREEIARLQASLLIKESDSLDSANLWQAKVEELTAELDQAQERIKDLEAALTKAVKEKEAAERDTNSLVSEFERLEREIIQAQQIAEESKEALRAANINADQEAERLSSVIEEKEGIIGEHEDVITRLREIIDESPDQVEVDGLKEAVEERDARITELEEELEEAQQKVQSLTAELEAAVKEKEAAEQRAAQAEQESQQAAQNLQRTIEESSAKTDELQTSIERLKGELAAAPDQNIVDALKDDVKTRDEQIAQLRDEQIAQLNDELRQARADLETANQTQQRLEEEKSELTTLRDQLQTSLQEAQAKNEKIPTLESQLAEKETRISDLEIELEELKEQKEAAEERTAELEGKLSGAEDEKGKAERLMAGAKAQAAEEKRRLNEKLEAAEQSRDDASKKVATLTSQLERVQQTRPQIQLREMEEQNAQLASSAHGWHQTTQDILQFFGIEAKPIVLYGESTEDGTEVGDGFAMSTNRGTNPNRPINEDSVGYFKFADGREVFVVADGMGGHASGEIASRLVIQHFLRAMIAGQDLYEAVLTANRLVAEESPRDSGSTLVAAVLDRKNKSLKIVHAGDSRAKLVGRNEDETYLLTKDHSLHFLGMEHLLGQFPIPLPEKKLKEFEDSPKIEELPQNVILTNLGAANVSKPDKEIQKPSFVSLIEIALTDSEVPSTLLLYSDGAIDGVKETALSKIARATQTAEETASEIIKTALSVSNDNITVIAVKLPFSLDLSTVRVENYQREEPAFEESEEPETLHPSDTLDDAISTFSEDQISFIQEHPDQFSRFSQYDPFRRHDILSTHSKSTTFITPQYISAGNRSLKEQLTILSHSVDPKNLRDIVKYYEALKTGVFGRKTALEQIRALRNDDDSFVKMGADRICIEWLRKELERIGAMKQDSQYYPEIEKLSEIEDILDDLKRIINNSFENPSLIETAKKARGAIKHLKRLR